MTEDETPPNPYAQTIRADLTWFFRDLFGMPHTSQTPPKDAPPEPSERDR